MFKSKTGGSLAAKLAHTSTLPALGNKDLRLLQDLITNEKTVLVTLQKLSVDLTRAAESLKMWGLGEGDDLGDVLSHACGMYSHVSTVLNDFANHQTSVRAHLKSIRTREEQLDELKRKRKSVAAKADSADKKLSKMSGEHKNLPAQTDLLNRLRDEIRQLDTEIMVEEARLGDFKRLSTRNFMALKFGGLLEFGEKATIVGELGKLLIEEIPLDPTPPGQPRAFFQSQTKTSNLAAEAARCVGEIVFNAPPDVTLNPDAYAPPSSTQAPPAHDIRASEDLQAVESMYTRPMGELRVINPTPSATPDAQTSEFGEAAGQRRYGTGPSFDSPRTPGSGGPGGGGQFSTFPVKARTNTGLSGASLGDDFSASVTSALRLGDNGMEPPPQQPEETDTRQPQTPTLNVGGRAWDGSEYQNQPSHNRTMSQESTQLPWHTPEPPAYSSSTFSADKGVRFRTPSMEVSGMTIAPGVNSPAYPSSGSGWRGPAAGSGLGGSRISSDAPTSPVSPNHIPEEPDDLGDYYNPYDTYDAPDHGNPPASQSPPQSPQEEERMRNAAAARDIAREIDIQLASPTSPSEMPPSPPQPSHHHQQPQPSIPPASPLSPVRPLSIARVPSPLAPPTAPFAQPRSVSPGNGPPSIASPVEATSPRGFDPPPRGPAATSPLATSPMPSESYGTPPEYPSPPPPMPAAAATGPRTISAAAFKRRMGTAGSDVDLAKKRPLPSSPYPPSRSGTPGGSQDNVGDYGRLPPGARPPDYFGPGAANE